MTVTVKRVKWSFNQNGPKEPAVRIERGSVFLCVPMKEIRGVVDMCHDRADDHDREPREFERNK